jgi:hypothetical protein
MRLPAKLKKLGAPRAPRVRILLGKIPREWHRYLDRLAFDLAQEWSEDSRLLP